MFSGHPCTHVVVQKHLICRQPHPTQRSLPTRDFPFDASFPRPISSMSWLACQLLVPKLALIHKRREKKEAGHSILVGGSVHKQENLLLRLVLGTKRQSLHSPARIFKVYIEALAGFDQLDHQSSLNNTLLLWGWVLREGSSWVKTQGIMEYTFQFQNREGGEEL